MSVVDFLYQKVMLSQSGEAREGITYEITAYTAEDILAPMASFPARPDYRLGLVKYGTLYKLRDTGGAEIGVRRTRRKGAVGDERSR